MDQTPINDGTAEKFRKKSEYPHRFVAIEGVLMPVI